MPEPPRTTRRRALGLLFGGAAAAVAGGAGARRLLGSEVSGAAGPPTTAAPWPAERYPTTTAPTTTAPTTTSETSPPTTTTTLEVPAPELPPPYEPIPGEVEPDAKRVAARVVEALTTYAAAEPPAVAVGRAAQYGSSRLDVGLLQARAEPLLAAGLVSVGRVVYPQLGGLDPHWSPQRCSVMVVVDQRLGEGDAARTVTRTVDVRLRVEGGQWRLDELADASGEVVERPGTLSAVALRALDHPGLVLPDSTRWDVYEGVVDDRVLAELAGLADRVPLAVTTCRRGHPVHVFGTDRVSAHTAGRAVDVWAVGGVPVVAQHTDTSSVAYALSAEICRDGRVSNFGSPWWFEWAGGRSFTDPVHHDHLHLGFSASA